MRKSLIVMLAACSVLFAALGFCACKAPDPSPSPSSPSPEPDPPVPHTHAFVWETEREATCTEEGLRRGKCSCGESETEQIPALGHTFTAENRCERYDECGTEWAFTDGLIYTENDDGTYAVSGVGTAGAEAVIPYGHEGEFVTSIAPSAFSGASVTSVTLPASIKAAGAGAFTGASVSEVHVDSVAAWCGLEFADFNANPLMCSLKNVRLYLMDEELTDVEIPEGVTSIGMSAFIACVSVEKVHIPTTLKSVGQAAFSSCPSLKEIHIPDVATWCGIEFTEELGNPLLNKGAMLYLDGEPLTDLVIPKEVKKIEKLAFKKYTALESVTAEAPLSIGSEAFNGCSVERVCAPDLATWCAMTFEDGAANPLSCDGASLVLGGSTVTEITVPAGTEIKAFAFWMSSLQSVTVESGSIGEGAFEWCEDLASVTLKEGVSSIGDRAFRDCTSLTGEFRIPDSVTSVGGDAFNGCTNIRSFHFGTGLKEIGGSAFCNCNSITDVVLPDSLTQLGDSVFQYCEKLKTVDLGNGVTALRNALFFGCNALERVTIGSGVTDILRFAFSGCTASEVVFRATDGWSVSQSADMTGSESVAVSNPAAAAALLSDTYKNYYWKRS